MLDPRQLGLFPESDGERIDRAIAKARADLAKRDASRKRARGVVHCHVCGAEVRV